MRGDWAEGHRLESMRRRGARCEPSPARPLLTIWVSCRTSRPIPSRPSGNLEVLENAVHSPSKGSASGNQLGSITPAPQSGGRYLLRPLARPIRSRAVQRCCARSRPKSEYVSQRSPTRASRVSSSSSMTKSARTGSSVSAQVRLQHGSRSEHLVSGSGNSI